MSFSIGDTVVVTRVISPTDKTPRAGIVIRRLAKECEEDYVVDIEGSEFFVKADEITYIN